jgi:hypothetical protein
MSEKEFEVGDRVIAPNNEEAEITALDYPAGFTYPTRIVLNTSSGYMYEYIVNLEDIP